MIPRDDIDRIGIELEVGGAPALELTMTVDGGIRRAGYGAQGPMPAAVQGTVDPAVFAAVRQDISDEMLTRAGRYTDPAPKGVAATLSVTFSAGEDETGIAFRYGSQSQGPPPDLSALVRDAVTLTDAWYQAQLSAIGEQSGSH
jgi:hypothetical protein